jgi:GNAT superfamily N-acetyltransferase
MPQIRQAVTPGELEAVRRLMRAFVGWHGERHRRYRDMIDRYFDPQEFDAELERLPGAFAPPRGRLLVACAESDVAGCVALQDLRDGTCEMKRMFVRTDFHGRGIGRALGEAIVAEARAIGYKRMRLDTGPEQREARGLYRRLGFREVAPYRDLDAELRAWLVFMELDLGRGAGGAQADEGTRAGHGRAADRDT